MDPADLERFQRFLEEVAEGMANVTVQVMEQPASATDKGWDITAHAANYYDQYLEGLRPPLAVACSERCDFCCHLYVSATIPEVIALAEEIRTSWPPEEQADLLRQLESYRRTTARLPLSEVATHRRPCPLLRDRRCGAYNARPLACRGWHSLDAVACEENLRSRGAAPSIPLDARGFATTQLSQGIREGLRTAGRSSHLVGLVEGLYLAMVRPDLVDAWERGERSLGDADDACIRSATPELDIAKPNGPAATRNEGTGCAATHVPAGSTSEPEAAGVIATSGARRPSST